LLLEIGPVFWVEAQRQLFTGAPGLRPVSRSRRLDIILEAQRRPLLQVAGPGLDHHRPGGGIASASKTNPVYRIILYKSRANVSILGR